MLRKSVSLYEYLDGWEKFNEELGPGKKRVSQLFEHGKILLMQTTSCLNIERYY